jgi:aryl-alcohol dehydrogenase-like predicted oxidoreductase
MAPRADPKVPADDQLGTLRDLQAQGKIRHIGLSEVSVRQIQRAVMNGRRDEVIDLATTSLFR